MITIILQTCKSVYDKIIDLRIATPQIVMNYGLFLEENNYFEEAFKVQINGHLHHILFLLYQHHYSCNAVFLTIVFFPYLWIELLYIDFYTAHVFTCIILFNFLLLESYKIFYITIILMKYCRHMRREQHCSSGRMYMTYGIPTLQSLWNDM